MRDGRGQSDSFNAFETTISLVGTLLRDRVANIRACAATGDVIAVLNTPKGIFGTDARSDGGRDLVCQLFVCVFVGSRYVDTYEKLSHQAYAGMWERGM